MEFLFYGLGMVVIGFILLVVLGYLYENKTEWLTESGAGLFSGILLSFGFIIMGAVGVALVLYANYITVVNMITGN